MEMWEIIVETVAKCNFTYASDILPSLSGIARSEPFSFGGQAKYLAGLWSVQFITQLGWRSSDRSVNRIPAAYPATTWSWASAIGPLYDVYRSTDPPKDLARLLEVHCEVKDKTSMGEVSGGFIVLEGLSKTMYYSDREYPRVDIADREKEVDQENLKFSFAPDVHFETSIAENIPGVSTGHEGLRRSHDRTSKAPGPCEVEVLLLEESAVEYSPFWKFLVLGRVDFQEEAYERLGLAWVSSFGKSNIDKWIAQARTRRYKIY